MKSLLFALGLALCCFVQANQERFENTDLSKIDGDWYIGAMATTCQKMKDMLPHMKASPVTFKQESADRLKMSMEVATPDGCKTMSPVIQRENGVFSSKCGRGGKKTVEYIEMNGDAVYTSMTVSHKKGQCTMATVLGRTLDDVPVAMEGFRAFCNNNGLVGEEVHVLSTKDMCPRSS